MVDARLARAAQGGADGWGGNIQEHRRQTNFSAQTVKDSDSSLKIIYKEFYLIFCF